MGVIDFCVLVFIDLFTDWGKSPLSGYVRFGETQLPVVSRTSSFGLDGSSLFELVLYNPRKICECI